MKPLAIRSLITLCAAWLLLGAGSAQAATRFQVSFTKVDPTTPAPGQPVAFETKANWNQPVTWAWNWEFNEKDPTKGWDQNGPRTNKASHSFTRGVHTVAAYAYDANNNWGIQTYKITVGRQPQSSFSIDPASPVTGQNTTFSSTSSSPDEGGQIVSYQWTVDGQDGGTDPTLATQFNSEGEHTVVLKVVDELGYASTHSETFLVSAPPTLAGDPGSFDTPPASTAPPTLAPSLGVFDPAPFIRIKGRTTGKGARVDLFTVRAARGARVWVRCVGKRCPKHKTQARAVKTKKKTATVRFRRIEGWFRAGTILEVRVTKKGYIGRYTRFRIGKLKPPVRWDGCLVPGATGPRDC